MTHPPMNRRLALKSIIAGGVGLGAGTAAATAAAGRNPGPGAACAIADGGLRADGRTPETQPLQQLLDRVAAAGGGTVSLPPGVYLLEKTLLLPSKIRLLGHGAATILRGHRPDGVNGFALLANHGITTAEGHEGAHDFSVEHLAIDSPRTNGIVLVHARNASFSHIHGVAVHHHFFDIAGCRNILTDHLFLTGHSGTAPYQLDGWPFNNNIWDGRTNVAPLRDRTINDGVFLTNSVIRPVNRPNHGIHFHRRGGRHLFIDNVLVEHVQNGIYRDANCSRRDVMIRQVMMRDISQRAIHFEPTDDPDRGIRLEGVTAAGVGGDEAVRWHGCRDLTLSHLRLTTDAGDDGDDDDQPDQPDQPPAARTGGGTIALTDITGGVLDQVTVDGTGGGTGLELVRCRDLFLSRLALRRFAHAVRTEDCAGLDFSQVRASDPDGGPLLWPDE